VSFALNNRPGVTPATRRRILAAASELGWRPSTRARALSRSRAYALGLVLSRPPELLGADPFFPQFLAGVEITLSERGMALVLQVVGDDRRAEAESYRRLAAEGRVDGVFLSDLRLDDARCTLVAELGLPAVAIGPPVERCPLPVVALDDRAGIGQAVDHLLALGHTRVAHVAGTAGYVHSASRRAAWRQALEAAGVPPGPELDGDFTGPGGAEATRTLLALPDPPTAIVYANDLMAIAGMGVARDAGLDLPADLSVVGFDDIPLAAHVTPALTTIRQDALAWGRVTARVLLAAIDGEPAPDVGLAPPELILRDSTGPPRRPERHGRGP